MELLIFEGQDIIQDVRLESDTIWLSQKQMTSLFGRDKSVISRHVRNVFKEGELGEPSVVAKFATTAEDGKTYEVEHFVFCGKKPPLCRWKQTKCSLLVCGLSSP